MRWSTAVLMAVLALAQTALTRTAMAAGGQVGTTTIYPGTASSSPGVALAFRFTASATGDVDRLNLYIDGSNTASRVEIGLYSGTSSGGARRRGRCVVRSPTPNAWNRCTLPAYGVTGGSRYWLAFLHPADSRGTLKYRKAYVADAPAAYTSQSSTLTSLPSSWASGADGGSYRASVYADLATPTPPPPTPAQCADGRDNDGDGLVDLTDPGCTSASDNDETNVLPPPPPPPSDTDGDGVPDAEDQCPNAPGPTSNNGCPTTGGLPPGVTLREPDGGTNYFARFDSNGPLDEPAYFPTWLWGQYDFTPANVAKDKSLGFNGYYGTANSTNENPANIANGGMWAMTDSFASNWQASPATIGYRQGDEDDMNLGPGWDQWNAGASYPNNCTPAQPTGKCGYTHMRTRNQQTPRDGRARIMNYGKGVTFWETDAQASVFINGGGTNFTMGEPGGFQNLVSADVYWFTDPDTQHTSQGQCFYQGCNVGGNLTFEQAHRAYNYGLTVQRVRELDALDGKRQPVFGQIEMGWWRREVPSGGYGAIKPAEMRAAFWHTVIAGARGVVYLPFSFEGAPCGTEHHIQRDTSGCYTGVQEMAADVNAQARTLAPVLNSKFADGYVAVTGEIATMAKQGPDGKFYVFAGNKTNTARSARFTLSGRQGTTATVIGEDRQIQIATGEFSDSFADGNTIHIYRID
jgi:hypothetical protein